MARVIEQIIEVRFSKIVKDSDDNETVLSDEALSTLIASVPELAESIINDPTVIVEVDITE